ncbi:G2/M phase-specific E3 ubiquitin-protein ligase-like isoform X1 [Xenia sp. Carnegie-2017]|uniref:G2/M phase-specific E3 ubiquitin-protein ligase-like isoform X1 n=1 Tax=Xenia sp. Carnegie-2017 TaxID=2897299 RepID=UPI001F048CD7|nr:G2/M phase-specific E3 ubiquitin-protein ligase-like isoform X1 [Xenia sp. Carnegie-2017]
MAALGGDKFKVVGQVMVSSIVQGGPAPCFFSDKVYMYVTEIISSITTEGWIPEVKDITLVKAIEKITNCSTDEHLQSVLQEDAMLHVLQQIHYRGVPSRESLQSAKNILRAIVMNDFSRFLPMLDQLMIALGLFNVIKAMKEEKAAMKALFVAECSFFLPFADQMLDGMTAEFSEEGNNCKMAEVDVYKFFLDFLQDSNAFRGTHATNTLYMLHKFITGCEQLPPLGLPKPITVKFKHGCTERCKCRSTASTCDLSITLPVHYRDSYNQLKEAIDSALIEGNGFRFI